MKNNLENAFKDSLNNLELPYDSAAWTAMSAKLDAVQPITPTPPKSTLGKWLIAAGTVATVSVGAYLYMNDKNEVTEQKQMTENSMEAEQAPNSENTVQNVLPSTSTEPIIVKPTNVTIEKNKKENHSTSQQGTQFVKSPSDNSINGQVSNGTNPNKQGSTHTVGTITPENIIAPTVKDICENEMVIVKNTNSVDLTILTPNKDRLIVKKETTFKSNNLEAGNYKIYANDNVISTFNVNHAPKVDFTIDNQSPFEDGLPSMPMETFSEGTSFTWMFDNTKNSAQGRTANAHFFTKGEHSVTLKGQNETGCSSEITKTVEISSDYNLFAPNAFEPHHSDIRRSKFIPNALLVRGSVFTMIIVNPKTGATLFSTSNAGDGWDGIDTNTGELVEENATFVWKVFLKNPLPGEKSEYSGTVIRK